MSGLVTPPGQTTTISSSGTYSYADIGGGLLITGSGVTADIIGATTLEQGSAVIVENGASLTLQGTILDNNSIIEVQSGGELTVDHPYNGDIQLNYLDFTALGGPGVTLGVGASNLELVGFGTGDVLTFASPAVSFQYRQESSSPDVVGTLDVVEADGSVVAVIIGAPELNSVDIPGFILNDGSVDYAPPMFPIITGTVAGQTIAQSGTITPFASVVITDANPGQMEAVGVSLEENTGTLIDPNAATDGSTYSVSSGLQFSGSASSVTTILEDLIFKPTVYTLSPGSTVVTGFGFSVQDTIGYSAFDERTSVVAVACYAAGTGIATVHGRVPVERLAAGDHVLLAQGGTAPIRWIGHRRVNCSAHPDPTLVWPVRAKADAFGPGLPRQNVFLSPNHAVFVDSVLIPIQHLVNGHSIAQVSRRSIGYWHVELERHDILLAEGLPTESYLDTGNRADFANGGAHVALHPDFSARSWDNACAELVEDGPRLATVKARLFHRSGLTEGRPALRLAVTTGRGRVLTPELHAPDIWRIALPPGTRRLRLRSQSWMPAACYAASLDRRLLGVRLFGIAVDGASGVTDGPIFSSGFHALENTVEGACRWTNGHGQLLLPSGARIVTLRVGDGAVPISARDEMLAA